MATLTILDDLRHGMTSSRNTVVFASLPTALGRSIGQDILSPQGNEMKLLLREPYCECESFRRKIHVP